MCQAQCKLSVNISSYYDLYLQLSGRKLLRVTSLELLVRQDS